MAKTIVTKIGFWFVCKADSSASGREKTIKTIEKFKRDMEAQGHSINDIYYGETANINAPFNEGYGDTDGNQDDE